MLLDNICMRCHLTDGISKNGRWVWFLKKAEPADITYCVEVFPKGSEMDLKPEEQAEEYADYCSVAGWELIDGQRKFCIFRRRDPDAMPIVTEEERFENVRKAERRELLWDMLVPVLLTAQFWCRALGREFVDWIFSPPYLWILLVATLPSGRASPAVRPHNSVVGPGKQALREGRPVSYGRQPFRRIMEWILVILLETGVVALLVSISMPKARSGSCRIHICYPDFYRSDPLVPPVQRYELVASDRGAGSD